jgi:7-alpha-hydroxysteroid dehydrogenase
MADFALTGKVALITGGGRGIGAAIARAFAGAGAAVAVAARTQADIDGVVEEIAAGGGRALAFAGDVNDVAWLPKLVDTTVNELGGLDVLVNNAGGEVSPSFLETRVEDLEAALHFNVAVPFELSRLSVPHLLERPGASIVNMSSVAVGRSVRGHLVHHTCKGALAQLTLSMAADLGPRIRVNALLPGAIETVALRAYFETKAPDLRDTILEHTRLRRMGTVHDVADAALFLASPAASWITGKLLEVDGGRVDELVSISPDL